MQMCMIDDLSAEQPCLRIAQWRWHPDPDDHPVFLCNYHAEPLTSDMAWANGRPWPYDGAEGRARMEPEMTDTRVGHLRPDHEDCECVEELDHGLHDCDCPGYPLPTATATQRGGLSDG